MVIRVPLSPAESKGLARLAAQVYDCDPRELARLGVVEMIKAHRARRTTRARRRVTRKAAAPVGRPVHSPAPASSSTSSPAPASASSGRTYQPKRCPGCGKDFTPTGPRAITCQRCRDEFAAEGRTGAMH